MNIKIGKYVLKTEKNKKDFILSEIKIKKEGNNIGEEYESDTTYHPTIEGALNNVFKRRLLESDADTLGKLFVEIQAYRNELNYLFEHVIE